MPEISKEQFVNEYSRFLEDGNAALFAGAGLSVASGMVDWRGLLHEIAQGLGLDVNEESDLIALAQYERNSAGNRHRLNSAIVEEFNRRAALSANHKWIAQLPIETIWTTNYDTLIEQALRSVDKRVDIKFSPGQLTTRIRNTDATVYKMHGDVSDPDNAVLTKDDYERYDTERQAFTELLRTDLTRYCFLFLGFSFTDPNIEYILSRLRQMLKGATRIHYCVMRRPQRPANATPQFDRDIARFRHRVEDLKRFGIQTIAIDDFAEIEPMLRSLVYRAATKNILVSGSAFDFAPFGKERLEALASRIGAELISRGYNLVSGYGLGIGGVCILGAHKAAQMFPSSSIGQRLMLRIFPQDIPPEVNRAELYTRIRREMIDSSGAAIFLSGNKVDVTTGRAILANGVMQEYELAKTASKILIPVPSTGHAALRIWQEIEPQLATLFPNIDVRPEFQILSNIGSSEDQIISAIFGILQKFSGH